MSEQSSEAAVRSRFETADQRSAAPRRSNGLLWAGLLLLIALGAVSYYSMNAAPGPVKLAIVTWNDDPFWDPLIRGAQDAAKRANASVEVIRSKPDVEAQNAHLRDLLSQGVAGIAVSLNNPTAQAPVLDEIASKATLVTVDADAPQSKRKLFVGIENYAAGQMMATEIADAVPDGGAVIISVGSIDMPNGRERRQGLIDALLDRPYKPDREADPIDAELKGPKYSVVATLIDNGDAAKAKSMITNALKQHPEVKCVAGLYSYSGPAAVEAIDAAGRSGNVQVVCFDETDATQAGIAAGKIHSSIIQDQYRCGDEAIRLLADLVRGKTAGGPEGPRRFILPTQLLRKENLDVMRQLGQIRQPSGTATTTPATPAS